MRLLTGIGCEKQVMLRNMKKKAGTTLMYLPHLEPLGYSSKELRADADTDIPGFTRSRYAYNHAIVAPESRVWQPYPRHWVNGLTAHLISPAVGATFSMYLADLKANGKSGPPSPGVERFAFVLDGTVNVTSEGGKLLHQLSPDDYAFFPAGSHLRLSTEQGSGLVVFERYEIGQVNTSYISWTAYDQKAWQMGKTQFFVGKTSDQPTLVAPGEMFGLRKLVPQSPEYGFNIHIMDFQPGQHLNVKEVHYNQHGLLLLQGQGIYRLGDDWYPVQSGDAVWMPPYVIQWYAALGNKPSRYILFKDVFPDPIQHGQNFAGQLQSK